MLCYVILFYDILCFVLCDVLEIDGFFRWFYSAFTRPLLRVGGGAGVALRFAMTNIMHRTVDGLKNLCMFAKKQDTLRQRGPMGLFFANVFCRNCFWWKQHDHEKQLHFVHSRGRRGMSRTVAEKTEHWVNGLVIRCLMGGVHIGSLLHEHSRFGEGGEKCLALQFRSPGLAFCARDIGGSLERLISPFSLKRNGKLPHVNLWGYQRENWHFPRLFWELRAGSFKISQGKDLENLLGAGVSCRL